MKQVFGSILMAVGILIAGASGLCSLVFVMSAFGSPSNIKIDLPIIFLVGGIPFGIGLAMFFGGRALVRQAKLDTSNSPSSKPQEPKLPKGPESPVSKEP